MSSELAPIAVFAFNRPEHLTQVLDALAACPEAIRSDVTVFCDGPRTLTDSEMVTRVRSVAHRYVDADAFGSVTVIEHDTNQGLAASLVSGISSMLETNDRIIVIEDDIVVSPDFLAFMNAALTEYVDDERVASIHGFTMNVDEPLPATFFIRGADCWGWATWQRAWRLFEPDGDALLRRLDESGLAEDFDFDGAFPYRSMLVDQINGVVDSWAIRWYASTYLADALTLYPGRSLVRNIGQEGSGTHSRSRPSHEVTLGGFTAPLVRIPTAESASARAAMARALRSDSSWARRWQSRVHDAVRRVTERGGAG